MNKGYFVPMTIVFLLLVLSGIVLFVPLTQIDDLNNQNNTLSEDVAEIELENQSDQEEELPASMVDEILEETITNIEVEDSTPKIPAGMPTPECAQDPNCANQLGCITDPESGMTICY